MDELFTQIDQFSRKCVNVHMDEWTFTQTDEISTQTDEPFTQMDEIFTQMDELFTQMDEIFT